MAKKRVSWNGLIRAKREGTGEKIVMVTAYDYCSALLCEAAGVDIILVGDSLGNVILGYDSTLGVTLEDMIHHTRPVVRAAEKAQVVLDMPYGSYEISTERALVNAITAMKQSGADALKLEGGAEVADTVRALTQAGIPVIGHLGLTPQSVKMLGGYVVQGKTEQAVQRILADARALEQAGAVMLVLECVPAEAARYVSAQLGIPTIGIGAGSDCDGQVLVFHDLLGISPGKPNKFVKVFAPIGEQIQQAVADYAAEVRGGTFPAAEHCFSMVEGESDLLKKMY